MSNEPFYIPPNLRRPVKEPEKRLQVSIPHSQREELNALGLPDVLYQR
jgi:hypothetical protein